MCVYGYVQLTSKAAADRKHYSNHVHRPLTAKTWHLSATWATAESSTHQHTSSNRGFGPLFALSFPEAPVGFDSGPLQGVVIVPLLLIKYLIWANARLLAETMKRGRFFLWSFLSRNVLCPSSVYYVVTTGTALKDFGVFVDHPHPPPYPTSLLLSDGRATRTTGFKIVAKKWCSSSHQLCGD